VKRRGFFRAAWDFSKKLVLGFVTACSSSGDRNKSLMTAPDPVVRPEELRLTSIQVVDTLTGEPVSGASITVPAPGVFITDAQGKVRVPLAPRVRMEVCAEGYLLRQTRYVSSVVKVTKALPEGVVEQLLFDNNLQVASRRIAGRTLALKFEDSARNALVRQRFQDAADEIMAILPGITIKVDSSEGDVVCSIAVDEQDKAFRDPRIAGATYPTVENNQIIKARIVFRSLSWAGDAKLPKHELYHVFGLFHLKGVCLMDIFQYYLVGGLTPVEVAALRSLYARQSGLAYPDNDQSVT
jgi:hypothetical protein